MSSHFPLDHVGSSEISPTQFYTSGVRIWKFRNPDPIRNFFIKSISNPYPRVKNSWLRYPIQIRNRSLSCTIAYIFGSVYFVSRQKLGCGYFLPQLFVEVVMW